MDDLFQFRNFLSIHQKALFWRSIGHVFQKLLIFLSIRIESFVVIIEFGHEMV